ncbi:MAG TPA: ATP synthase subunit I [Burkholderiales bacterium]|jgi:ATP synthase protein I|nr:ATP synthase subunit I [Burkholderiales bacterium]
MSFFPLASAGRPARTVLWWQGLLTAAALALAAYFAGIHGVVSAGLGGVISMASGLLFAAIATVRKGRTVDDVLLTAFKAEAAKIVFIVLALWLVMATYKNVVAVIFIGTFIATISVSSMAFFVSDRRE